MIVICSFSFVHSFTSSSFFILSFFFLFFFNDTPTTEIYTLSLHDALPISLVLAEVEGENEARGRGGGGSSRPVQAPRSEEHTSELQSLRHLVCRLLLEKKKTISNKKKNNNK